MNAKRAFVTFSKIAIVSLSLLLAACGTQQIRPGMSSDEVVGVLGEPTSAKKKVDNQAREMSFSLPRTGFDLLTGRKRDYVVKFKNDEVSDKYWSEDREKRFIGVFTYSDPNDGPTIFDTKRLHFGARKDDVLAILKSPQAAFRLDHAKQELYVYEISLGEDDSQLGPVTPFMVRLEGDRVTDAFWLSEDDASSRMPKGKFVREPVPVLKVGKFSAVKGNSPIPITKE